MRVVVWQEELSKVCCYWEIEVVGNTGVFFTQPHALEGTPAILCIVCFPRGVNVPCLANN